MKKIVLQTIGPVDNDLVDRLQAAIESEGWDISVGADMQLPPESFDSQRRQYDARDILALAPDPRPGISLLVADVDLFITDMNFIFGLAQPEMGKAIISLSRLRHERYGLPPNRGLFLERATKVAIHELGHLQGLDHCPHRHCAMYFYESVDDTDLKGFSYCSSCQARLLSPKKRTRWRAWRS